VEFDGRNGRSDDDGGGNVIGTAPCFMDLIFVVVVAATEELRISTKHYSIDNNSN